MKLHSDWYAKNVHGVAAAPAPGATTDTSSEDKENDKDMSNKDENKEMNAERDEEVLKKQISIMNKDKKDTKETNVIYAQMDGLALMEPVQLVIVQTLDLSILFGSFVTRPPFTD